MHPAGQPCFSALVLQGASDCCTRCIPRILAVPTHIYIEYPYTYREYPYIYRESTHSYECSVRLWPALSPAEDEWLLSQTQPSSLQRTPQAPGWAVAPNEAFASTVHAARERTPIAVGVGTRCGAEQGQWQRQRGVGDSIGLDAGGLMCSFFPWQGADAAAGRAGEHVRGPVRGAVPLQVEVQLDCPWQDTDVGAGRGMLYAGAGRMR